jgi:L-fucose mutarotase
MLKNIDPRVTPELLHTLARAGHGDEIALVDANFPSYSVAGAKPVIELPGLTAPAAAGLLLQLIPLDDFVAAPCLRMQVVGDPERVEPVQREVQSVVDAHSNGQFQLQGVERLEFYERAAQAFAIVRSSEQRLYGCFLFKVGIVRPAPAS